jgi:hypothetical protein
MLLLGQGRKSHLLDVRSKGTTLSAKRFDQDNSKVSKILEMTLADVGASVNARKLLGDGRSAYLSMYSQYQSTSKNETRVQEVRNKLKTLQYYRATKNFPWTSIPKFVILSA